MRSAKHEAWSLWYTTARRQAGCRRRAPTLGRAGGEGDGRAVRGRRVGWRCPFRWRRSRAESAAEAETARGGLLVHFADLLRHPPGRRAQPPRRYHPHQTPARRPPARVGAEPAGGAGIPLRGPPPAAPPGRSLPPAPRAPPSRLPANCVPPGPARSHMPPQGMPGLSGGGRVLGRARPGWERPTGKVGEKERASQHPRPACAPPRPDRGISHLTRPTR